jgi:hypothetical protein
MGNLDYIQELGIGESQEVETEATEKINTEEEQSEVTDFVQEQEDTPTENTGVETEQPSEMEALRKQIDGMEKRIADKDKFIEELREASKQKEAEEQQFDTSVDEEDFWDNPEATVKKLQDTIKIQQLQIQETIYANTVDDYWKTVNPEALKEAVATDTEFTKKFNSSNQPYKVAYEYLKGKADSKTKAETTLREQIKAELMAEMGIKKEKKEVPPSINGGSKSSTTKNDAPADGFSSMFGDGY